MTVYLAWANLANPERASGITEGGAGPRRHLPRIFGKGESDQRSLLRFLIEEREAGKRVVGYGAPAKANTLLNYCGVRTDLLEYTVDRSPHKQGHFLPGTHIPVYAPDRIRETKPDYVLILPWNLKDEVLEQMADVCGWGGKFVVPIPKVRVLD